MTETGIPIPGTVSPHASPAAGGGGAARIIVFGNEKGGWGKSTAAMHTVVGLLRAGQTVGSIDVDPRQATLTRYLENRAILMETRGLELPMPSHRLVARSTQGPQAGSGRFTQALASLSRACDAVGIATPRREPPLSRPAHSPPAAMSTPIPPTLRA